MKSSKLTTLLILIASIAFFASCDNDNDSDDDYPNYPPIENPGNGNEGIGEPTATTDPGVVINGIRWATRNVNAPGTFANNPEDAGMFFQWNRNRGWSTTNPLRHWANNDWVAGGWDNSTPTGVWWYAANDPCPLGWRVPSSVELTILRSQPNTWTQRNGVNGKVFGSGNNTLFLPAAGWRVANDVHEVGSGRYWSNMSGHTVGRAWGLHFYSGMSVHDRSHPASGFSVRCVAE